MNNPCIHTHTHTHTHTHRYDSAIKMNEIFLSAKTWMDLVAIMPCEVSLTEKDKCYMISLIHGSKKKNELT